MLYIVKKEKLEELAKLLFRATHLSDPPEVSEMSAHAITADGVTWYRVNAYDSTYLIEEYKEHTEVRRLADTSREGYREDM